MRPSREKFRQADQTYFATFQTARRQYFFRHERWTSLLLATLDRYSEQLGLHDFVIMPDHVHLLQSPQVPLERAVQLVKGGFSFAARRAFDWKDDIWQTGFTDHRTRDIDDWDNHCEYIRENALSKQSEDKAMCGKESALELQPLPPWLKPHTTSTLDGGAEAPPLQGQFLQSQFTNSHSEVPKIKDPPPNFEKRTAIHYAANAEDLFRKLGI